MYNDEITNARGNSSGRRSQSGSDRDNRGSRNLNSYDFRVENDSRGGGMSGGDNRGNRDSSSSDDNRGSRSDNQ